MTDLATYFAVLRGEMNMCLRRIAKAIDVNDMAAADYWDNQFTCAWNKRLCYWRHFYEGGV